MYLITCSSHRNKTLGLVSGALFVMLFLALYRTMRPPSHSLSTRPPITDKLGPRPPAGQASGSQQQPPEAEAEAAAAAVLHPDATGHVLPGGDDLVLHDAPATYPRLARLSDGSILLGVARPAAPAGDGATALAVSRSVDDGRTFRPWGEVTRCAGDCDNLFLLEVPGTAAAAAAATAEDAADPKATPPPPRVLAAFRNHDVDPAAGRRPTYFRITVCESRDAGRTWAYLSQAAEKPAPDGLWEPFLRLAGGGGGGGGADGEQAVEVQMTYSQELEPRDQDTMARTSRDGGRTWSAARTATGGGERLRDGMNGVAATTDRGRPALVMVLETTRRPGAFSVEAVVSYDDGATWGGRQVVCAPADPGASAGAPQVGAFAHGGLAVVFMSDADVDDAGGRDWPRKATVKAVFGGPLLDGKIRWGPPEDACPTPSSWPGVFRLNGSRLLAACEHEGSIRGRILEWA